MICYAQKIPELLEYAGCTRVDIFRRSRAWRCEEYFIEHDFHLDLVDMAFKVSDLYRRVKF